LESLFGTTTTLGFVIIKTLYILTAFIMFLKAPSNPLNYCSLFLHDCNHKCFLPSEASMESCFMLSKVAKVLLLLLLLLIFFLCDCFILTLFDFFFETILFSLVAWNICYFKTQCAFWSLTSFMLLAQINFQRLIGILVTTSAICNYLLS